MFQRSTYLVTILSIFRFPAATYASDNIEVKVLQVCEEAPAGRYLGPVGVVRETRCP